MTSPFTRPRPAAARTPATIPRGIGRPASTTTSPPATAPTPKSEPTDRSSPPAAKTKLAPTAATNVNEAFRVTSAMFCGERKTGLMTANTPSTTTSAMRIPSSRNARSDPRPIRPGVPPELAAGAVGGGSSRRASAAPTSSSSAIRRTGRPPRCARRARAGRRMRPRPAARGPMFGSAATHPARG